MIKVITYGTFDLLHYGHLRLLERAKSLGDYLIVGITSDDFDKTRGKINNQQSLMERIIAIKATGLADEIIVEEYEGQKIDDIKRLDVDIFTLGSDWTGKFDYLNEYCKVIYLDRTEGISSSEIRSESRKIKIKVIGSSNVAKKFINESKFINGVEITNIDEDSYYLVSNPENHYELIKSYLINNKNVLCESPIALNSNQCIELFKLANDNNCLLFDGIKTAYSIAYSRLLLLVKSGKIGEVVSVDVTCTSMKDFIDNDFIGDKWNTMCAWGPTALLPIFQILGTEYKEKTIVTKYLDKVNKFDGFTKINFIYNKAVASLKIAQKAKSEGELVITGTKGYIYVPAPWWKTDYFEVRYEDFANNKRYYYQLDGEGIRYEIAAFAKTIGTTRNFSNIDKNVSIAICKIIEEYYNGCVIEIE